jgi:hypothetical protein
MAQPRIERVTLLQPEKIYELQMRSSATEPFPVCWNVAHIPAFFGDPYRRRFNIAAIST